MKIDPDAAGMDEARLERITEHLTRRYVEPGKIAGCQTLVMRKGHIAYVRSLGLQDRERGIPVADDTIWRIFSMSKPVTGVALMTLYEQGHFQLDDPVHRFIPEWRDLRVRATDADGNRTTVPCEQPMTIKHLLMHMSGLGYEFRSGRKDGSGDIQELDLTSLMFPKVTLEQMCTDLADYSLHSQPGTRWLYSVSTDVCGRLVEIISGQRFDEYLQQHVFAPLGMVDTGFAVTDQQVDRFAALYARNPAKELTRIEDPEQSYWRRSPVFLSGGAGLVSTTPDYLRFAQMLLNGGEVDGARILGRKTVELMTTNHLPGGREMPDFASGYGEIGFQGQGFGLTMAVGQGPARTGVIGSAGEFMWGGAASTAFWVDPAEELIVIFMVQFIPSGTFDFRRQLRTLVYPAIVD